MTRIIVTGGCGFIGSNFLHHMIEKYPSYKFINIDKLTYSGNLENVKELEGKQNYSFIREDIINKEKITEIIQEGDIIVNFAAESHVDNSISNPEIFIKTNVLGTQNLLDIAREKKAKLFVQISTDEVYGSLNFYDSPSLEEDKLNPSSPYSSSKAAAEMFCLSNIRTFNQPIIITRSSNNFGLKQFPEKIIPLFVTNLLEGKKVPLYGEGKNIRDWIYVRDNCEAIDFVIHKGVPGNIYNIGGNNEIQNIDLVKKILSGMNKEEFYIDYVEDRLGHDLRYSLNCSKIKNLGWTPRFNFNDALNETINWYENNGQWWRSLKNVKENSNNKIKYLIFGKGYLGKKFNDFLEDSAISDLRIENKESVIKEIEKYNPDFVINCVGKTGRPNVDWCEDHKEETTFSNITVPLMIASACQETSKKMVHIGSGCIYEGDNGGEGFSEEDEPNFYGSYYSITKKISESMLKNYPVLQLRIRMPLDDDPNPRNLITKLLQYDKIVIYKNSLTYLPDFFKIAKYLIDSNSTGIFNIVNKNPITHEELLQIYQEISGEKLSYKKLSCDELDKITRAKRSNCVLSTKKLEGMNINVPDVRDALRRCFTNYVKKKNPEKSSKKMKGILLAGGAGTRLHPLTLGVNKHLLPIYDKPMIYYSLSVLMLAGIREILIISTPQDIQTFRNLLGDGLKYGCKFSYAEQLEPKGIAEAFILGEEFIGKDSVTLILGDNIFYGYEFGKQLEEFSNVNGAMVFAHHVSDPERFGVVEFNKNFNVISIEEKPEKPKSNYVIPGLYFYDNSVIEIAKGLTLSSRGEYEITDINKEYLKRGKLKVKVLKRGTAWLDTGTFDSLIQASQSIQTIEKRQGLKIGSIEEVAYRKGFIEKGQLLNLAEKHKNSNYGDYLKDILEEEDFP